MDPVALKGETRPPKFMRCYKCGSRGHRVAECRGTVCTTHCIYSRACQPHKFHVCELIPTPMWYICYQVLAACHHNNFLKAHGMSYCACVEK